MSKKGGGACLVGDAIYRLEGAFAVSNEDVREPAREA
jgi:hypothetical protein